MYLSKIHLHGFKSFAQKTELHFDPGLTAIVGPNGCGKSNVVDAVRWVLGEQRARLLRSEKMENVIFNGTSKRRALGMAEVSLTIQNTRNVLPTEYSEVMLTRRLYRSGESEYLLNNIVCRLKDIQDLFMDTGMGANAYSIIELKMIDDILSESAQDRRRLFEEAAGITKYKMRRGQALRKLDITQADLTRIRDLTSEIEKQVRSLERQAKKAGRYVELKKELEELEFGIAKVEFDRFTSERKAAADRVAEHAARVSELDARLAAAEAELEVRRTELIRREQALAAEQRKLNAHIEESRKLELNLRLERERLSTSLRDISRVEHEQGEAGNRLSALSEEIERFERTVGEAEPKVAEAEAKLEQAREAREQVTAELETKRRELAAARVAERKLLERLSTTRQDLDRVTNRIELQEHELERLRITSGSTKEDIGRLEALFGTQSQEKSNRQQRVSEAESRLRETADKREQHNLALEQERHRLQVLHRRHDALKAEATLLEGLIASYEEFSDSVRFLATNRQWSGEKPQTVADLITCPARDRLAIDAALGQYASCFVVESEAEARAAISLLHSEQKGQAAFFVVERLPVGRVAKNGTFDDSRARPATELVRVPKSSHRQLIDLLLQECYVVDSFEEAKELASRVDPETSNVRFVARTGEWAYPHGLLYGGSRTADAPSAAHRMDRREQLDAVNNELIGVRDAIEAHETAFRTLQDALDALPLEPLQAALREAEHELRKAEQEEAHVRYELDQQTRQRGETSQRIGQMESALEEGREKMAALRSTLAEIEAETESKEAATRYAEGTVSEIEERSRSAISAFSEANIALMEARNHQNNLLRDLDRLKQEREHIASRQVQRKAEVTRLRAAVGKSEGDIKSLEEQLEQASAKREQIEQGVKEGEIGVNDSKAAISETEAGLRLLRRDREGAFGNQSDAQSRRSEVQARLESLVERLAAEYSLNPEQLPAVPDTFDERSARDEIPRLRNTIRNLGAVNELALEDYESEKERLAFMREQQQDLEAAEHTLLSTIREINTTAARRFDETFESIQTHFRRIFAQLFTEGDAEVFLTGEKDPLESPIEIVARPRGKKPSTIAQLSGGEKTLTAIALLFAIYLVKPSPFCILDEVDAPLDDANVERFMRLIRDFSESTQFILVTHNKRTMESADRMYGITMQEQGVSKLVGVTFDERLELVA